MSSLAQPHGETQPAQLLAFLPERAYISMGFQAFLAENLLCVRQPLTLLGFRQGVIKKGIKHRCCFGL